MAETTRTVSAYCIPFIRCRSLGIVTCERLHRRVHVYIHLATPISNNDSKFSGGTLIEDSYFPGQYSIPPRMSDSPIASFQDLGCDRYCSH